MNAQASPSITSEHMLKQCPSNATQQTQRNATNATSCSPQKTPRVPDAPDPVDNEVQVTREDVLRTRVVLAQLRGEQERLTAELEATGLTDFADRADWLIDHRTPDQQHAWRRHWRRLGLADPEPHGERFQKPTSLAAHRPQLEHLPRPSSLAVPVPVRPAPKRREKPAPVISVDRQLEIAMNVLAKLEAA